jgi:hypothetical protein
MTVVLFENLSLIGRECWWDNATGNLRTHRGHVTSGHNFSIKNLAKKNKIKWSIEIVEKVFNGRTE